MGVSRVSVCVCVGGGGVGGADEVHPTYFH